MKETSESVAKVAQSYEGIVLQKRGNIQVKTRRVCYPLGYEYFR